MYSLSEYFRLTYYNLTFFSEFFGEEDSALFFKFVEDYGGQGIDSQERGKLSVTIANFGSWYALVAFYMERTFFGIRIARLTRAQKMNFDTCVEYVTSWCFPEVVLADRRADDWHLI